MFYELFATGFSVVVIDAIKTVYGSGDVVVEGVEVCPFV